MMAGGVPFNFLHACSSKIRFKTFYDSNNHELFEGFHFQSDQKNVCANELAVSLIEYIILSTYNYKLTINGLTGWWLMDWQLANNFSVNHFRILHPPMKICLSIITAHAVVSLPVWSSQYSPRNETVWETTVPINPPGRVSVHSESFQLNVQGLSVINQSIFTYAQEF